MEVIALRGLWISSPLEQKIDFTQAAVVITTDANGLKSWVIELEGPSILADFLIPNWEIMQLTAETEDGRTFHGSAFVSQFRIEGTSVQAVFRGTGPLTPRPL